MRLFANVKVGPGGNENDDDDEGLRVSTKELLERYSGVVLAHGAAETLDIDDDGEAVVRLEVLD